MASDEAASKQMDPVGAGAGMTPLVGGEQVAKVVVANVYAGGASSGARRGPTALFAGATVELELAASTTIGSLKARLADSFAERPAPSEQRLIYCGKICKDESSLRDVLRSLDGPQTFHLVLCRSQQQARPQPEARPPREEPAHALPADVLEAAGRSYERHLALAAVYAEALREGRWTRRVDEPRLAAVAPAPRRFAASAARLIESLRANPVLATFDVKLLLKLAVVVALLGHDGDAARCALLVSLAVVAFLVQTGLAGLLLDTLLAASASFDSDTDWRRRLHRALATGRIPRRTGRFFIPTELAVFLATFTLSLAPAWRPAPAPDRREHAD